LGAVYCIVNAVVHVTGGGGVVSCSRLLFIERARKIRSGNETGGEV